jgi:hypothetical protein
MDTITISETLDGDEICGECSTHGEMRNKYKIQAENLQGREHFGRFRCRWEDVMKIYIKGMGCENVDMSVWLRT